MRSIFVGVMTSVMAASCGKNEEIPSAQRVEADLVVEAVAKLGAVVVAEDAVAFEKLIAPGMLAQLPRDAKARGEVLLASLRGQKAGWLHSLGADAANPKIAEILPGVQGEYSVRLQLVDGRDEKKLWFVVTPDGVFFVGPNPEKSAGAERSISGVLQNWNWRWQNNTSFVPKSASYQPFTCPFGSGNYSHAAYSNIWKYVSCEPWGFGSCRTDVTSTYAELDTCKSCLYQWVGADVWWQPAGNPVFYCGS
ncbi:MAG: hypothetical protein IAE78_31695 [Myxococcus sp.]|nr:hypothetical protein [Myxococcus sp.]